MKTLFAVAVVLLLSVSLLSAFLPGEVLAAEKKITAAEMSVIKKAADEALAAAKLLVEKAKTEEEKSLAEELLEYAAVNAEVAADLLKTVQEGGSVDRETAENCAAVAKAVHKAAAAIASGDAKKAGDVLDGIAETTDGILKSETKADRKKGESKTTADEMMVIQKDVAAAVAEAKLRLEQAKTEEERAIAKELLEYAEVNAKIAAEMLKIAQQGGSIDRKLMATLTTTAKSVNETITAIAKGDMGMEKNMINLVRKNMSYLIPIASTLLPAIGIIDIIGNLICLKWHYKETTTTEDVLNVSPPPLTIKLTKTVTEKERCIGFGTK